MHLKEACGHGILVVRNGRVLALAEHAEPVEVVVVAVAASEEVHHAVDLCARDAPDDLLVVTHELSVPGEDDVSVT